MLCHIYNTQGFELKKFNTDLFGNSFILGRSDSCDVSLRSLNDRTISRVHLVFTRKGNSWTFVCKGRSGCRLNGEDVTKGTLADGQVYRISQLFLAIGEKTGPSPFECSWEAMTEDNSHRAVLWYGVNTIGASRDNYQTVRTDDVSRVHAKILVQRDDKMFIEALYRGRYTAVNDNPVVGAPAELKEGDVITLGETDITVKRSLRLSAAAVKGMEELQQQELAMREAQIRGRSGDGDAVTRSVRDSLSLGGKIFITLLILLLVAALVAIFWFFM